MKYLKIASYYMGKVLMSKKVSFYRSNGIVTYVQEYVGQTIFNLSFKSNCRLNTVMVDWAISLMISSQFNENLDWSIHETLNYFNILQTTIGNLLKCFRYHYRKYWNVRKLECAIKWKALILYWHWCFKKTQHIKSINILYIRIFSAIDVWLWLTLYWIGIFAICT